MIPEETLKLMIELIIFTGCAISIAFWMGIVALITWGIWTEIKNRFKKEER